MQSRQVTVSAGFNHKTDFLLPAEYSFALSKATYLMVIGKVSGNNILSAFGATAQQRSENAANDFPADR